MFPRDTSREARNVQIGVLCRLGGVRRIALAFEMSSEARALSALGIRRLHPKLSEAEARARVLSESLYRAAFEREPS